MRLICIVLMLSSLSCVAKQVDLKPTSRIETPLLETDPRLYSYIDSFKYEALMRGVVVDTSALTMGFGMVREKHDLYTIGYCIVSKSGTKIIRLHEPSWNFMDIYEQEALVFHELGHCILGRILHCDNKRDNKPISMLSAIVPNGKLYKENREELLDELFSPNSECKPDPTSDEVNRKVRTPKVRQSTK